MNKNLLRKLILEALSEEERNSLYDKANDEKALKKAYRKLLQKHHPDRANEEDQEEATSTTQEINQIYSELTNKDKGERSGNRRTQSSSQNEQSQNSENLKREIAKKIMVATTISGFKEAYTEYAEMKYGTRDFRRYLEAVGLVDRISRGTFKEAAFLVQHLDNLALKISSMSPSHILAYIIYINQAHEDLLKRDSIGSFVKNYEIAASVSPMNVRPDNRKILEDSVLAVKKIGEMMSFLKRAKYMFLGPSTEEVELMVSLINRVSNLRSGLDFQSQLKRIILD